MDGGPPRGKVWWLPLWVPPAVPAGNQQERGLQRLLLLRDLGPQGFKQEDSLRPRLASHPKELRPRAWLLYFLHGSNPLNSIQGCALQHATSLHCLLYSFPAPHPLHPHPPPNTSLPPRSTDRAQMLLSLGHCWGHSFQPVRASTSCLLPLAGPLLLTAQPKPFLTLLLISLWNPLAPAPPRILSLHCTAIASWSKTQAADCVHGAPRTQP